jgi:hypothetical protein
VLIASASPAIFKVDVAILDISGALEPTEEGGPVNGCLLRGEKTYYWPPALLWACAANGHAALGNPPSSPAVLYVGKGA